MTKDKVQMCDACDEHPATQRILYEQFCDECYPRKKALYDAERRASGRQIDYAELALGVEERDAELAEARADVARFEAALDVANRELAEARRERDEARTELNRVRTLYLILKEKFDIICVTQMFKPSALIERQRRTIRALVVAARGMNYAILRALVGWGVPPSDKLAKQATTRIKYGIMRTREAEKE